jgi:hypothetical protein
MMRVEASVALRAGSGLACAATLAALASFGAERAYTPTLAKRVSQRCWRAWRIVTSRASRTGESGAFFCVPAHLVWFVGGNSSPLLLLLNLFVVAACACTRAPAVTARRTTAGTLNRLPVKQCSPSDTRGRDGAFRKSVTTQRHGQDLAGLTPQIRRP